MTIVDKLVCVYFDYLILNTIAIPFAVYDPVVWAWYSLCIALAFVLRIGMEHKKHRLTWNSLLYQSICTISWCFFMILVWNYLFTKEKKGFEIYLFINSLFAVFMVSQFEEIFEIGFKKWIKIKLGKFLAVESTEEER
jgi:hypothetical protein